MKLTRVNTYDTGALHGYSFVCPGCKREHVIPTEGPKAWGFNGNVDAPTFTPSIHVHPARSVDDDGTVFEMPRCHSFVTDGRIQFLSDSTHALAGQTVELSDVSPRG